MLYPGGIMLWVEGLSFYIFLISPKMHYFVSQKFMSASGAVSVNEIYRGFVKGGSSPPLIFTFLLLIFPSPAFLLQNNPVTGSFCTFHTGIYLWEALLIPLGVGVSMWGKEQQCSDLK